VEDDLKVCPLSRKRVAYHARNVKAFICNFLKYCCLQCSKTEMPEKMCLVHVSIVNMFKRINVAIIIKFHINHLIACVLLLSHYVLVWWQHRHTSFPDLMWTLGTSLQNTIALSWQHLYSIIKILKSLSLHNLLFVFMGQVSLLKSIPLRLCANILAFNGISLATSLDWTNVSIIYFSVSSASDEIPFFLLLVTLIRFWK
jgi:hypothetical protein